jgi:formiminotetrahydrofolate cyclodeaminase
MDPITIIASALVAGAAAGVTSVAEQGVKEAYNGLKALIQRKFGDKGDVVSAVEQVEKKPESSGRQQMLKEELADADAGQDAEVLKAAQDLLALLQPKSADSSQQAVADHGAAAATGRGAAQVGDGNIALTGDIQGGVTIGQPPPKEN